MRLWHLALLLPVLWLSGCDRASGDRPAAITWDRDTCEHCRMTISDRAYAAQVWVEPQQRHYRFDDLGCLVSWLDANGWTTDQVRLWVADHRHRDRVHWLDARTARYLEGMTTPMDYGFGATDEPAAGSLDFETAAARMRERDAGRQR